KAGDSVRLGTAVGGVGGARCLVQGKVAREPQKHGVPPEEAVGTAVQVAALLDLRGFMAMGPARGDPRPAFAELRHLRDEAEQRLGSALPILSMGMREDLGSAGAVGRSKLRVGRALFGERPRSATPGVQ